MVAGTIAVSALAVGLLCDLGAGRPLFGAAIIMAVSGWLIDHFARERSLMVVEVATPIPERFHYIGNRVVVVCSVPKDPSEYPTVRWYRLANGAFLHSHVIRRTPNTGQPKPPQCPR